MTSLIPPSLTRGYIEEKVNMDRLNLSFLYLWYCKLFKQFGFTQQDITDDVERDMEIFDWKGLE